MGPQGLYLNKWTPDFDPSLDVPSAVPVWVRLPHLPLHCWNSDSLEAIGNTLGKYIDKDDRKDQFSYARIYVEVDLEIGLSEAINLTVAEWSHIQELDYEQIPFKCRLCHGYGHFSCNCKKKSKDEMEQVKDAQWTQVQKARTSQGPRKKGKEKSGSGVSIIGEIPSQAMETSNGHSNQYDVLISSEDILEEG